MIYIYIIYHMLYIIYVMLYIMYYIFYMIEYMLYIYMYTLCIYIYIYIYMGAGARGQFQAEGCNTPRKKPEKQVMENGVESPSLGKGAGDVVAWASSQRMLTPEVCADKAKGTKSMHPEAPLDPLVVQCTPGGFCHCRWVPFLIAVGCLCELA